MVACCSEEKYGCIWWTTWSTSQYHRDRVKSEIHIAKLPAKRTRCLGRFWFLQTMLVKELFFLQSTSCLVRKWNIMRQGQHGQPTDPTGLRKRHNKRSKRYFDHLRPLRIKTQVQCMLCANQCRTRGICEEFLCHLRSVELRSVELRSTLRLSYKCAGRAPRCPMFTLFTLFTFNNF